MGSESDVSALGKFWRLEGQDKRLVIRAVISLAIARIRLARYSFQRLSEQLAVDSAPTAGAADSELIQRVSYAIGVAAKYVPWRSDCFPQCIAARSMLEKRGIAATIHLGVERAGESDLESHAWLTCGDRVVTGGGADLQRFTEVHRYPG